MASTVSRVGAGLVPLIFGSILWPLGLPQTFALTGGLVLLAVIWMAFAAPRDQGRSAGLSRQ